MLASRKTTLRSTQGTIEIGIRNGPTAKRCQPSEASTGLTAPAPLATRRGPRGTGETSKGDGAPAQMKLGRLRLGPANVPEHQENVG